MKLLMREPSTFQQTTERLSPRSCNQQRFLSHHSVQPFGCMPRIERPDAQIDRCLDVNHEQCPLVQIALLLGLCVRQAPNRDRPGSQHEVIPPEATFNIQKLSYVIPVCGDLTYMDLFCMSWAFLYTDVHATEKTFTAFMGKRQPENRLLAQ
jgi:hypothetical protein